MWLYKEGCQGRSSCRAIQLVARASPAQKLPTPSPGPHCTRPGPKEQGSSGFQGELGRLSLKTPDDHNIDSIKEVSREDSRITSGPIFQKNRIAEHTIAVLQFKHYFQEPQTLGCLKTDGYPSASYYPSSTPVPSTNHPSHPVHIKDLEIKSDQVWFSSINLFSKPPKMQSDRENLSMSSYEYFLNILSNFCMWAFMLKIHRNG